MGRRTPEEIAKAISALRDLYIPHLEGGRVIESLRRLTQYGSGGSSAAAGIICGDAGVGKTSALLAWMSGYPVVPDSPADIRKVALAKMTGGKTTFRTAALDLLRAFGDFEVRARATAFDLIECLILRIRQQQTMLLAIDEAQLIVSSKEKRVLFDVLEWLKTLLNDSPCPLVFIGSEELLNCLHSNPSFYRRVEEVVVVRPYDWSDPAGRTDFRKLCAGIDHNIPHLRPAGLEEPEMATRLFLACGGKVGLLKRLLVTATQIALERDAESLTLELLAEAFTKSGPEGKNPFVRRPNGRPEGR